MISSNPLCPWLTMSYLADIYSASREQDPGDIHSRQISAKALQEQGTDAYYFGSFAEIEDFLSKKMLST